MTSHLSVRHPGGEEEEEGAVLSARGRPGELCACCFGSAHLLSFNSLHKFGLTVVQSNECSACSSGTFPVC